jgi:glycosyltransferase involved in cell wall biosynthesis
VQNKIYEGLALGKAVISGDGPAVRRALRHGEEIYLCERANPAALAAAIRTLRADPTLRRKLAEAGRARFQADFTIEKLGERFKAHLQEI